MTFKISLDTRNAQVDGIIALLGSGIFSAYTGTQPASTSDAATGTLITDMTLAATAAPAAVNGFSEITLPVSGVALAAGDLGWGRLKTSGGVVILDGTISLAGNGGDIITDIITAAVDDTVQLSLLRISAPAI